MNPRPCGPGTPHPSVYSGGGPHKDTSVVNPRTPWASRIPSLLSENSLVLAQESRWCQPGGGPRPELTLQVGVHLL